MEINITEERTNEPLGRTEVTFQVDHADESTPSKAEVRKKLSATKDADEELVVVKWMKSEFGRPITRGRADIYTDQARRDTVESRYAIARNTGATEEE